MSGTVITSGGETQLPGCTAGPVGLVEDACLPSGSPALVVFIGGKQQQEYCKLEVSQRPLGFMMLSSEYYIKCCVKN